MAKPAPETSAALVTRMADIERTHNAKDVAGFTWLFELNATWDHRRRAAPGWDSGDPGPEHRASTPGVGRPRTSVPVGPAPRPRCRLNAHRARPALATDGGASVVPICSRALEDVPPWTTRSILTNSAAPRVGAQRAGRSIGTVALRVSAAPSQEDLLSALPIAASTGSNGRAFATIVAITQVAERYRPEILRPTSVPLA